jgi:CheY-like chemotaxis protein
MGGRIGVTSTLGAGSTFWFELRLPFASANSMPALERQESLRGARILVVDDHATNRHILDQQLLAWGAEHELTSNAREALDLMRAAVAENRPHQLVVLDRNMPEMGGTDLARQIRTDASLAPTPLVMLSSMGYLGNSDVASGVNIDAYLNKPVRQADLYKCLTQLLGARPAPTDSAPTTSRVPDARTASGAYILVAEDNPVNQELALYMLEDLGCCVDVVTGGEEAIAAVRRAYRDPGGRSYDLVFMDCQMPDIDGYCATAEIRRHEQEVAPGKRIPIVALTANAMEGDKDKCLAAGMDDYLSKPFTRTQLGTMVWRWVKDLPAQDSSDRGAAFPARSDTSAVTAARLDPQALDSICALERQGRPNALEKIIRLYLDNSRTLIAQIEAGMTAEDSNVVRNAAHGLKSVSASVGALDLAALCRAIEGRAKSNTPTTTAAPSVQDLQREHTAVCLALNELLQDSATESRTPADHIERRSPGRPFQPRRPVRTHAPRESGDAASIEGADPVSRK